MTIWIIPESDREGRAVCQVWLQGGSIVPGVRGMAVIMGGMAALSDSKAKSAILVVTPIDSCTSKSPKTNPLVLTI